MKLLLFTSLILSSVTLNAQKAFNKNDHYLQLSYSPFGNKLDLAKGVLGDAITGSAKGSNQFSLGFEYGATKDLGIGFQAGTSTTNFQSTDPSSPYHLKVANYYLQLKAVGYFINTSKFNMYSTFGIGLQQQKIGFTDQDNQRGNNPTLDHRLPVSTNLSAGMRYFITKRIGIHADGGLINWNTMQTGVTIRF